MRPEKPEKQHTQFTVQMHQFSSR